MYYKLTDEINHLKDTYSLCSGLLVSNPSIENINSCDFIVKKIDTTLNQINDECPHITFYTKYIK